MALSAGTRLGPYEILEPLGAGGMGEVYRAKDTKLGRDVPTKVLPTQVAAGSRDDYAVSADGQRFLVRQRVEQERKLQTHVVLSWPSLLERATE